LKIAGHIQETEAEWKNRKRMRQGKKLLEPLYTAEEGRNSTQNFESVEYMEIFEVDENIRFRLSDAGHMLRICNSRTLDNRRSEKLLKLYFQGI